MVSAGVAGEPDLFRFFEKRFNHSCRRQHGTHEFNKARGHPHGSQEIERHRYPAPGDPLFAAVKPLTDTSHFQGVNLSRTRVFGIGGNSAFNSKHQIVKILFHHHGHLNISMKASIRVRCCPMERRVQSPSSSKSGIPAFLNSSRNMGMRAR